MQANLNLFMYLFQAIYKIKYSFFAFVISSISFILETSVLSSIVSKISSCNKKADIGIYLYQIIAIFIFIFIAYRVDGYCLGYRMNILMKKNVAQELMDILFRKYHQYYENHAPGELSDRINTIIDDLPYLAKLIFYDIIRVGFGIICCGIALIIKGWIYGAIFFILLLSLTILMYYHSGALRAKSQDSASAYARNSGKITDILYNILGIKLFSNPNIENKFIEHYTNEAKEKNQDFEWKSFSIRSQLAIILMVCQTFNLLYMFYNSDSEAIILVLSIYGTITSYIFAILHHSMRAFELYGKIAQAYYVIYSTENMDDFNFQAHESTSDSILSFDHVNFAYHGHNILENINFTIYNQDKIVIIGPSGAGKSTILKLILRLYEDIDGDIKINAKSIKQMTRGEIQQAVVVITQDPIIFNRSVLDNLFLPENYDINIVMEIIQSLNLDDIIKSVDDLHNINIGISGTQLSGGQMQRIAIARVLCNIEFRKIKPKILIIDEGSSALDPLNLSNAERMINKITTKYNITRISVTHNMSHIQPSDKVIVVLDGKICGIGNHEELLKTNDLYIQLVGQS